MRIILTLFVICICCFSASGQHASSQSPYQKKLNESLSKRWNTWSYGSMLTHVLLPDGLSMRVNFRKAWIGTPYDPDYLLEDISVDKSKRVRPIAHTFDGSYTELIIDGWFDNKIRVQSATANDEQFILITPIKNSASRFFIELQVGMMWNQPGAVQRKGDDVVAQIGNKTIEIHCSQELVPSYHNYTSPYLATRGDSAVAFYTGKSQTLNGVKEIILQAEKNYNSYAEKYTSKAEAFKAIQTVLGWNTLYDPASGRVITPVTRGWNEAWQGYVLFEWDTYFAALLFGIDDKELAYSNALAITNGTRPGHVGFWQMPGEESTQSQPPVGSMVCWMLFEKYHEKDFIAEVFDPLLEWNRWWINNRLNQGYLTWGAPWKNAELKYALLESGLDNSPMYEGVTMQEKGELSLFNLADVGLNSLYVADCKFLARMASVLGKKKEEKELTDRAAVFSKQVQTLWSNEKGIYLNKYLDREESSTRLSPTLFYPMMAGISTPGQAERMIKEHIYNTNEFFGDYMLPSISFNDKSFNNDYWRGSVWGPMNFLVYLGLKNYNAKAAKMLADKSYSPFMTSWKDDHYVLENINSIKGANHFEDQVNSDPFYHWGALMGLMLFMEDDQY